MRKLGVMAVAISLLFASVAPVSAGPPVEESFDFLSFNCDLSGEAGSGLVSVFSDDAFAFAEAAVWLPGNEPFEDEPDLFSDFEGVDVAIG